MQVTLSDNTVIEILAINLAGGTVDWKRTEGYIGACVTPVNITDLATVEPDIKVAIELDIVGQE